MKISQKLQKSQQSNPTFSFEFFVPKTSQGVQNLYDRMDRMYDLGPQFIDVTWNAGGRLSNLTCEMVNTAQSSLGLETCMHLTCTGMPLEVVKSALKDAHEAGCQNILALRGDAPRTDDGEQVTEFQYAKDLIKYIRQEYGDYFDIGVAAYPEGHPEETDIELLIKYLKEKVDAGATFVITQMFYDADNFLNWVRKCRSAGITVPIIPGIMPISTYAAFERRATWCDIQVPNAMRKALEPISNDDMLVRETGARLVAEMCQKMLDSGLVSHLHFYTMNLEKATVMVLERLKLISLDRNEQRKKALSQRFPWRQSLAPGRKEESVRPIFWKNKKYSYVSRTQDWDEFPNGRWGDSRSPAFGELDNYGVLLRHSPKKALELWGAPETPQDLANLFTQYISGKVAALPWSDMPISAEVGPIRDQLIQLNQNGILTINCQPAINGLPSSDSIHGWGPGNGYVYQKAYLEVLVPRERATELLAKLEHNKWLSYFSVDKQGNLEMSPGNDGTSPNAVTWGVFPGREIVQPTIVEKIAFLAWKDEAFRLADEWANCYDKASPSYKLLHDVAESWVLINIVHNDFTNASGLFDSLLN